MKQNQLPADQKAESNPQAKQGLEGLSIEDLRLSQDFTETGGETRILRSIPMTKPNRQEYIRCHPDPEYSLDTRVLVLKPSNDQFMIKPELVVDISHELQPTRYVLSIDLSKNLFFWPLRLPDPLKNSDLWATSAMEAIEHAKRKWTRVAANMKSQHYVFYEANAKLEDPQWPEKEMKELIDIAFKDSFIDEFNHPVLRSLRGEI